MGHAITNVTPLWRLNLFRGRKSVNGPERGICDFFHKVEIAVLTGYDANGYVICVDFDFGSNAAVRKRPNATKCRRWKRTLIRY